MAITNALDLPAVPGAVRYYRFDGEFAYTGGATVKVSWATIPLAHPTAGAVEGRLHKLGPIMRGFPDAVGAPPERASGSMVLDDADGALGAYFVGGDYSGVDPAAREYLGHSFLCLRGRFYLGVVDPVDSKITEWAVTPLLVSAGSFTREGGRISIPLGSWDGATFGDRKNVIRVSALQGSAVTARGKTAGRRMWVHSSTGAGDPYTESDYLKDVAEMVDNLDQPIPFLYGSPTTRPIRVTPSESKNRMLWVLGATMAPPDIWKLTDYDFHEVYKEKIGIKVTPEERGDFGFKTIEIEATSIGGNRVMLWVILWEMLPYNYGASFSPVARKVIDEGLEILIVHNADAELGWRYCNTGLTARPAGSPEYNAVEVIRQLVLDHGGGAAAINTASFDRASSTMDATRGAIGLSIAADEPIADLIAAVAKPFGLTLWIDTDGRLCILPPNAWNAADRARVVANTIPAIHFGDQLAPWHEFLPTDPEARGAAVRELGIDWPQEIADVWPAESLIRYAPGVTKAPTLSEAKARISARALYPAAAHAALADATAARQFPARRFRALVDEVFALECFGDLVRLYAPHGAIPGGYKGRLARLERAEIDPGTHKATAVFEDLGALENMLVGVLDSDAPWLAWEPPNGTQFLFTNGSETVKCVQGIDTVKVKEGRSFWTFGTPIKALRGSYRIVKVHDKNTFDIDRKAGATGTVTANGFGTGAGYHRRAAMFLENHSSAGGAAFRADRIRLANEATATFTNTDKAFRFSGG